MILFLLSFCFVQCLNNLTRNRKIIMIASAFRFMLLFELSNLLHERKIKNNQSLFLTQ
jgi:hypothetical protein